MEKDLLSATDMAWILICLWAGGLMQMLQK